MNRVFKVYTNQDLLKEFKSVYKMNIDYSERQYNPGAQKQKPETIGLIVSGF